MFHSVFGYHLPSSITFRMDSVTVVQVGPLEPALESILNRTRTMNENSNNFFIVNSLNKFIIGRGKLKKYIAIKS